jgi:transaldolase
MRPNQSLQRVAITHLNVGNFSANNERAPLEPRKTKSADVKRLELDEKKFRYLVDEDAMATEKTMEGIRKFASDIDKLEKFVARKIN